MRRLTLILASLPVLLFACKDDANEAPPPAPVTTEPGTDPGPTPQPPIVVPTDDAGTDAAVFEACVGSPLGDAPLTPASIAEARFLDGPQWITEGDSGFLVYSEVDNQVIVRNSAGGGDRKVLRAMPLNNLPIGNAVAGGFIYTALSKTAVAGGGGGILKMKLDGTEPTTVPTPGVNSPNDLVGSSKGFVYFTDPGYQTDGVSTGVYRLAPDGVVTTITKFEGGTGDRADGIALSKDETALFVGFFDTKRVTKYTLDAEGLAKDPVNLPIALTEHPAGIAIDSADNIWVAEDADGEPAKGLVEVFDATGKKWGEIPFADARPSGVAFGGPDGKTVYITTERGNVATGTLYTVPTRCAGVR